MNIVSLAVLALAGVPTTDDVPTDFVAYRVEHVPGENDSGSDAKYVVHTPFNSVERPLKGLLVEPGFDGAILKIRIAKAGALWPFQDADEFRFDRGRVQLVRENVRQVPFPANRE